MVVDLIGIYVLKGPYCTLTTTNWFLQALSVIPRGSWGDVARRFTMIRWASPKLRFRSHNGCGPTASCIPEPLRVTQSLLVQADEGLVFPVVDLIRRIYRRLHLKSQIPCEFGWSQAPRRQQVYWAIKMRIRPPEFETSICDVKYHVSLVGNIVIFWKDFTREKSADGFRRPAGGRFDDISAATGFRYRKTWSSIETSDPILRIFSPTFVLCFSNPIALFTVAFLQQFSSFSVVV
ncbi:G-type lectin S-receptor-like serine/threonine-protein kinase [Dorcoceras hygrometricum]|uniref:G-type lectin S-receptor-like serine/threonine-protein kinase n=1 Tax=Dorcoceras hygrometricum TaxID=472368 RepID=A0A2Z7ALQ4_9LAMI|nr:G-type lectin S-receptor-like serine/threonine-protein kinase [Dorcoceras hygrometricum]